MQWSFKHFILFLINQAKVRTLWTTYVLSDITSPIRRYRIYEKYVVFWWTRNTRLSLENRYSSIYFFLLFIITFWLRISLKSASNVWRVLKKRTQRRHVTGIVRPSIIYIVWRERERERNRVRKREIGAQYVGKSSQGAQGEGKILRDIKILHFNRCDKIRRNPFAKKIH